MIQALVLDVDGVLTDGGVVLDDGAGETKRFHSRDGVGIRLALTAGWRVLFLTARGSVPARRRAEELGAEWAIGIAHKQEFLERWLREGNMTWDNVAYVADDLPDLACMRRVGWPVAVADAAAEVRDAARYVTALPGGSGAVREAVEWLLVEHGLREKTVGAFLERKEGFAVGKAETMDGKGGGA
jgi:3-deoxy-D-manno-octulosonate 8-phosphate phosphatase (KDO 8-P phosphatase)